ncbi:hypothetical protein D0T53_10665 [Dysgonomonas sp. 216]|uniref:hypothetical protein n=1 Tax=Dysgonomonas sp. 216 TaxID=2302934 RepID=UPI0013D82633|nr:hypothetical protein [Dysgonomonas sp. 216]NDW19370.1 hypothetical protein [Dysgonomonas sp. 216]
MLENVNKKAPFKVPENYFDNFQKELLDKIPKERRSKVIVPLWKKIMPWVAVAAVMGGIIFYANIQDNDSEVNLQLTNVGLNQKVLGDQSVYASADDEDFYLFLEDEATRQAIYTDVVNY